MSIFPLAITWDVDPVMFNLFGRGVRYYGILWAAAFLIGLWIFDKIIKREKLPTKILDSAFWYTVVATVVGARIGHCFFYDANYYLANPWEIFAVWHGGFASHGAAVGILVGLWLFSRKNKMPYIWSLDRIGIVVATGGAAIRIGNLFNSEIYGTITSLPWGFIFVRDGQTEPMHPTQIYEAIAYLITFGVLWYMYIKKDVAQRMPGAMFGVFLIMLFGSRFFIEFIKNIQEPFEAQMALTMGQWLSIPFVVAGVVILVRALKKKKQ